MLDIILLFFANTSTQIALSGAMGGAVRWLRLREPFLEGLRLMLIGAITAHYAGRAISPMADPLIGKMVADEYIRLTFVGFLIGFSGSNVWGLYADLMQARRHMRDNLDKTGPTKPEKDSP